MIDKMGSSFRDYAPLMSRLGLGIIIIVAGGYTVAGRTGVGLPRDLAELGGLPNLIWGLLALIAGLLIIIGFATRLAGAFLFIVFLVAIIRWYGSRAFTSPEQHLLLACLALSLSVFCGGGGEYSVDNKLQQKKAK